MDMAKLQDTKAKTVEGLTGGIEYLFKKYGVEYYKGKGSLKGPNAVSVDKLDGGSLVIDTKNILIATGSEVTPLPPVPVDNQGMKIVDSTGALEIKEIPAKMAVIGGGVIGLEMGSVWSRLGKSKVLGTFHASTKGRKREMTLLIEVMFSLTKWRVFLSAIIRSAIACKKAPMSR
jgi:pyruvate/2-oxoglutarate dehydrogenase complex dihydrolipoamide dehydrogenase (E3) component